MPSSLVLAESVIKERLAAPVPETVYAQTSLLAGLATYSDYLVDSSCTKLDDDGMSETDPGFTFAMAFGLDVAVYGLGQVIRQSKDLDPLSLTLKQARLVSGCRILDMLTRTPRGISISTEIAYGFVPSRFSDPRLPLSINGSDVSLSDGLIGGTNRIGKGCPFRFNLAPLYPQIVEALLPFYDLQI